MKQASQASHLVEPSYIGRLVGEAPRLVDPASEGSKVRQSYRTVGHIIDEEEDSALIIDPLCHDCPIVGASKGFEALSGYARDQMLGRNCRVMLHGVPEVAISKSVRKNLRDFCRICRMQNLHLTSEVSSLQPNARTDGSQFMNFFMIGLVKVHAHPYLLAVNQAVGEGLFVKLSGPLLEQVTESCRAIYKRIRWRLLTLSPSPLLLAPVTEAAGPPGFSFFGERLQDHCLLLEGGQTALRREPQELATNCLVFGNKPVRHSPDGLFFAVLIDDAVTTFEGLPLVGFTRRKPADSPDLYPSVSRCLGASVLVGACGEAFARDKNHHFKIGFKPFPQDEVQSWSLQPHLPPHKRRSPVGVSSGDILGCQYTRDGHIVLWRNGVVVLDFDVGRPVDETADYYAVVDVCLAAYCLTIQPMASPLDSWEASRPASVSSGEHGEHHAAANDEPGGRELTEARFLSSTDAVDDEEPAASSGVAEAVSRSPLSPANIDDMVSCVVNGALVQKVIQTVVADCRFCVTIADPKGKDISLIAVSEAFESMTGYTRNEILGMNCRFLNQGCPISPMDVMGLRMASESGSAFTALLPNRKKSGEMFINLLDLRGLTIARHLETNEELWFLIGIQADVTGLAENHIPEDNLPELQEVARMIRRNLRKELSQLAANGAERYDRQLSSSSSSSNHGASRAWRLLEEPGWTGSALSQQSVLDLSGCRQALLAERSAQRPRVEPLAEEQPVTPRGPVQRGMIMMGAVAFLAGLLFGRGTRRW